LAASGSPVGRPATCSSWSKDFRRDEESHDEGGGRTVGEPCALPRGPAACRQRAAAFAPVHHLQPPQCLGRGREVPHAPRQTFHQWYKENRGENNEQPWRHHGVYSRPSAQARAAGTLGSPVRRGRAGEPSRCVRQTAGADGRGAAEAQSGRSARPRARQDFRRQSNLLEHAGDRRKQAPRSGDETGGSRRCRLRRGARVVRGGRDGFGPPDGRRPRRKHARLSPAAPHRPARSGRYRYQHPPCLPASGVAAGAVRGLPYRTFGDGRHRGCSDSRRAGRAFLVGAAAPRGNDSDRIGFRPSTRSAARVRPARRWAARRGAG
jgi:hypothetical protein